jgi:hypothetical protein
MTLWLIKVKNPTTYKFENSKEKLVMNANALDLKLDCSACKTPAAMMPAKVAKFSSVVRVIGVILLVPSFLGIGFALLVFAATIMTSVQMSGSQNEAQQTGQAIGFGIGFVFSLIVGISSLVGGLLGWLLLLNRKVYKCVRCGFILDRA